MIARSSLEQNVSEDHLPTWEEAKTLLDGLAGRAGIISSIRPERPKLGSTQIWAYVCEVSNLRRIMNSAASDDWFNGRGRGWTQETALITSIAEAVEGYAACLGGTGANIRFASARELESLAVHPEKFVRVSESEAKQVLGDTPLANLDSRVGWVEGHRLGSESTKSFLPAQLIYGGYNARSFEAHIQFATSKGIGVQWSDDACILHGLCEIIESDAFMITYLNRRVVPEIDLRTVEDPSIQSLLALIGVGEIEFIRAWDITTNVGVPVVLVALGGSLHGGQAVAFGSAANIDPIKAITKALQEALHTTAFFEHDRVAVGRSWDETDFDRIRGQANQKLLGVNQIYLNKLDWLFQQREKISVSKVTTMPTGSTQEILDEVIRRAELAGLDLYACQLHIPDVTQATGLRAWRVMSPQAHPFSLSPVRYLDSERLRNMRDQKSDQIEEEARDGFNTLPHFCP